MSSTQEALTFSNILKMNDGNGFGVYEAVGASRESTDSVDSTSTVSTLKLPSASSASVGCGVTETGNMSDNRSDTDLGTMLVRKKSGELLKSSLKLPTLGRSMSTPHLSRNKSVRFATCLTDVKMFDGTESPSTVSTSDNSPVHSPQYTDHHFDSHHGYFSWAWNDDEDVTDITSDTSSDDDIEHYAMKYDISTVDIKTTKSIFENQHKEVYLHSVKLNGEKDTLTGLIMVKNLAFEKHLSLKLTFNNWKSNLIVNNVTYFKSFNSIGYDQFKFQIPLNNLPRCVNIQLVVRYDVNERVYWDNNDGTNYHISLKPYVRKDRGTIRNYNYEFKSYEKHFEELAMRLHTFQKNDLKDEEHEQDSKMVRSSNKSEFHNRYNINEELVKPRSLQFNDDHAFKGQTQETTRPSLISAHSAPDVTSSKPKYSRSYMAKQKSANTNSYIGEARFNSKSYSDLLQSYCFFNGSPNSASATVPNSIYMDSPTSIFHSLGDSIHN